METRKRCKETESRFDGACRDKLGVPERVSFRRHETPTHVKVLQNASFQAALMHLHTRTHRHATAANQWQLEPLFQKCEEFYLVCGGAVDSEVAAAL